MTLDVYYTWVAHEIVLAFSSLILKHVAEVSKHETLPVVCLRILNKFKNMVKISEI